MENSTTWLCIHKAETYHFNLYLRGKSLKNTKVKNKSNIRKLNIKKVQFSIWLTHALVSGRQICFISSSLCSNPSKKRGRKWITKRKLTTQVSFLLHKWVNKKLPQTSERTVGDALRVHEHAAEPRHNNLEKRIKQLIEKSCKKE